MKPIFFILSLMIFCSCGDRKFIAEHGMQWKNQDGGDAARITFVLQGIKKGNTALKIKHKYHGEFNKEELINCTVK